jgi:hypothetical protein
MRFERTAVAACALFLFACGGGGGGGGGGSVPALADLAGTWSGQLEDGSRLMHTYVLTIDGSGNITQFKEDGSVIASLTATVSQLGTDLFTFTRSDTTKGDLLTDNGGNYLAILDTAGSFGVLQKNGGTLTGFAGTDIANPATTEWIGFSVVLDASLKVVALFSGATLQVLNSVGFPFSGADALGPFVGMLPTADTSFGRWEGTFDQAFSPSGTLHAFLSIDKRFAGTWKCPTGFTDFVTDCAFAVMAR